MQEELQEEKEELQEEKERIPVAVSTHSTPANPLQCNALSHFGKEEQSWYFDNYNRLSRMGTFFQAQLTIDTG